MDFGCVVYCNLRIHLPNTPITVQARSQITIFKKNLTQIRVNCTDSANFAKTSTAPETLRPKTDGQGEQWYKSSTGHRAAKNRRPNTQNRAAYSRWTIVRHMRSRMNRTIVLLVNFFKSFLQSANQVPWNLINLIFVNFVCWWVKYIAGMKGGFWSVV